jgi:hypothetical protein
MPTAIKNLLKKAGFKKKALTNRETALDIFKMLIQEVDFNTLQKEPAQQANSDASVRNTMDHRGSESGRARTGSISSLTRGM